MRLQARSRNHALPSRGPRILPRNRDRVHSLGHAVASPQSSPVRPPKCEAGDIYHKALANNLAKLATSPSKTSNVPVGPSPLATRPRWPPHSSPVRLSECVAGNSPTKSVNKLPKPATSHPALALCRRWIGDDVVSYRAGRRDYTVCISPACVSGKNPVTD